MVLCRRNSPLTRCLMQVRKHTVAVGRSLTWSFPQNLTRPTFLAQCVLGPGHMLPICSWSEGIRVVMFFSKRSGLGRVFPSTVEETEGLLARVSLTKSYVFQDFSISRSLNNNLWLATNFQTKPPSCIDYSDSWIFSEFLYNFSRKPRAVKWMVPSTWFFKALWVSIAPHQAWCGGRVIQMVTLWPSTCHQTVWFCQQLHYLGCYWIIFGWNFWISMCGHPYVAVHGWVHDFGGQNLSKPDLSWRNPVG